MHMVAYSRGTTADRFLLWIRTGMLINSATWVAMSAMYFTYFSQRYPERPSWIYLLSILMLTNAAAFVCAWWYIGKKTMLSWVSSFGLIGLNLVLSVTDQIGVTDIVVFVLNLWLCVALLIVRKAFFAPRS